MLSNSDIKDLKTLQQKKHRDQTKEMILEGHRLIRQSLKLGAEINKVWATEDYLDSTHGDEIGQLLKEKNIKIEKTALKSIQRVSNSQNSQGIIAKSHCPSYEPLIDIPYHSIFLDDISDPGNMGALLRTAHWFGIESVFLSSQCVDVFNPKVIRSGMGSHFYFKQINVISINEILTKDDNLLVIAGDLKGEAIDEFCFQSESKWMLVLGSEAHGISSSIEPYITHRITIPSHEEMESLNVVAAGSILLHHLTRK